MSTTLAFMAGIALAGWSSSAVSASWSGDDCDDALVNSESVFAIAELTAHPVDHVTIEPRLPEADPATLGAGTQETQSTPFLYLTPRVASVLRNIFGDTRTETGNDVDTPSSTLAEIETQAGLDDSPANEAADVEPSESGEIPLFQRRMYRIDI